MNKFTSILAIFDEKHEQQPAILRAIELAQLSKAKVHIVATQFMTLNFSYHHLQIDTESILRESMQKRLANDLKATVEALPDCDVEITYETLWSPRPAIDIADLCISNSIDLLIKTASKHKLFEGFLYTPLDWHLLRECPCSVMLVSNSTHPKNSPLIVAIDANSDDQAHENLNHKLLESANYLSGLFKDKIIAVNACPPLPVMTDVEYASVDLSSYMKDMKAVANTNTLKIIKEHELEQSNIKILEGIPEEVIPELAKLIDCRLIILGTVARSGLSGLFMGNTAEQILQNANCDILAIKPD